MSLLSPITEQRQLSSSRMLRADVLFGQLNTVRKWALEAKEKLQSKQQKK